MAVTDSRIKRLERALGVGRPGAPCARCRGAGAGALTVVREEHAVGTPRGGCPACGKVSSIYQIVLPLAPGEDPARDPWDVV
ncbi:MAG: hypothetical protein AB7P94_17980 [Steroidobacteraceae bacterium]